MPSKGQKRINGVWVTPSFDEVAAQVTKESTTEPTMAKALKEQQAATKAKADAMNVKDISSNLSSLSLELSRNLSQVQEKWTEAVQGAEEAKEAKVLYEKELEELFGKDVVAKETLELVNEYKQEQEAYEKKKAQQAEEEKEYNDNLAKSRAREKAEYEYQVGLDRKVKADQWADKIRQQEKANTEAQEKLKKEMDATKAELMRIDLEYKRALAVEQALPQTVEAAVNKAVAEKVKELGTINAHAQALREAEYQSEKKATAIQSHAYNEQIASLQAQVERLSNESAAKSDQVQEIAIAAVASASGREALESVEKVAMSKPDQGGKSK